MLNLTDPGSILNFLQSQGYLIIFLLMCLEGALITLVAAFAASLGIFNVYVIFLLAFFGNLIPDSILFLLGRLIRAKTFEKYIVHLGLKPERIKEIEEGLGHHFGKSLVMLKLTPIFSVPGIIIAGFIKVPAKKFFLIDITFNLISAFLFTALGFYFGIMMNSLFKYLKWEGYTFLVLVPLIIGIYLLFRKFSLVFTRNKEIS